MNADIYPGLKVHKKCFCPVSPTYGSLKWTSQIILILVILDKLEQGDGRLLVPHSQQKRKIPSSGF